MIEQENQLNQENTNTEVTINKKSKLQTLVQISLLLNFVLLIGVIILFVLHFKAPASQNNSSAGALEIKKPLIAYVNTDSLMTQYEFVANMKKELESKQKQFENSLTAKQKSFENEVVEYQKKAANNLLTMDQAKEIEQQLMVKQQNLLEYKENLTTQFATRELELNVTLYDSIHNFLKRFNEESKYHFILGYSHGGGILFANDSLDITATVVKQLNENYRKSIKK